MDHKEVVSIVAPHRIHMENQAKVDSPNYRGLGQSEGCRIFPYLIEIERHQRIYPQMHLFELDNHPPVYQVLYLLPLLPLRIPLNRLLLFLVRIGTGCCRLCPSHLLVSVGHKYVRFGQAGAVVDNLPAEVNRQIVPAASNRDKGQPGAGDIVIGVNINCPSQLPFGGPGLAGERPGDTE